MVTDITNKLASSSNTNFDSQNLQKTSNVSFYFKAIVVTPLYIAAYGVEKIVVACLKVIDYVKGGSQGIRDMIEKMDAKLNSYSPWAKAEIESSEKDNELYPSVEAPTVIDSSETTTSAATIDTKPFTKSVSWLNKTGNALYRFQKHKSVRLLAGVAVVAGVALFYQSGDDQQRLQISQLLTLSEQLTLSKLQLWESLQQRLQLFSQ